MKESTDSAPLETTTGMRRFIANLKSSIRWGLGNALNKIGWPGHIQPHSFYDPLMDWMIEITVSRAYTVISIDGRDYYFKRLTGAMDGTGSGCCARFIQKKTGKPDGENVDRTVSSEAAAEADLIKRLFLGDSEP